jgi:hypothetical protein
VSAHAPATQNKERNGSHTPFDAGSVYFGTQSSSPLAGGDIYRVDLAGGPPAVFVSNVQVEELLLDGNSLYYVDNISRGATSSLRVVPTTGGQHETIASDAHLSNVRVDASYIYYFADNGFGGGRILRVARGGSMSPPEPIVGANGVDRFAIDADSLYWAQNDGGGPTTAGSCARPSPAAIPRSSRRSRFSAARSA